MNTSQFSPPERLIFDAQGLIAEIKKQYFTNNSTPLDDNDTLVHKLCVRLENILRYGAREKYSFMGARKDYWNFISDCLQKDEIVKFVSSIHELKTNQGKGRALLRQALMEKCVADTLQRCAINEKQTREYYLQDSVLRNQSMLQTLVHSLYDLNAIDFLLPHKGYDLDRSFPSFSRKTFGTDSQSSRKNSTVQTNEDDPVMTLSGYVINLASLLNSWYTDETIKTGEESLSLKDNIDKVKHITSVVEKLRVQCSKDTDGLAADLSRVKEEKIKSNGEYEFRLKQLNERFTTLQNFDTSATEDKLKGLYNKLVSTELELTECKAKLQAMAKDNEILTGKLDGIENRNVTLAHEKEDLAQQIEDQNSEMERMQKVEHRSESTNKILENKLDELKKVNSDLMTKENESFNKIISLDSQLKVRDGELDSLKNAFQQSTGFVVGSFKEFKDELNSQLQEKSDDIKNISVQNQSLANESKSLLTQNTEMEQKLVETEQKLVEMKQKLLTESKRREEAERVVTEQKQKLACEMKHEGFLQNCMQDMWMCLLSEEDVDVSIDATGGTTTTTGSSSAVELKQDKFMKKLTNLKKECEELKKSIETNENDLIDMQRCLQEKTTEHFDIDKLYRESTDELMEVKEQLIALQTEHTTLQATQQDSDNDIITSLTTEVARLHDDVTKKQEAFASLEKKSIEMELEMNTIKPAFEDLTNEKESRITEQEKVQEMVTKLQEDLKVERESNENTTQSMENSKAKEASYKNEMKVLKGEIESMTNIKNQELQSLKFELSSLEMKYETTVNEMKQLEDKYQAEIKDKENTICELEQNVTDSTATFKSEKEAVEIYNVELQKKLVSCEEKMKVTEKEISFLKVQVAKIAKEKEEEKANRINTLNKLHNTIEDKKEMTAAHQEEVEQLKEDMRELKNHLVNVTQEKHDLWQKKDSLEFEKRQKSEERWVSDEEAKQCTSCLTDFSFTVRKHHCRLCGHIFCGNCSNQWLKTAHSRKKIRACRACAKTFHDKHGDKDVEDDDLMSNSMSDTISVNSRYESFDQNDDLDVTPGNFEVLDSSSITKSGSFGPTEQIAIVADTDEVREAVVPAPMQPPNKLGDDTGDSGDTPGDDELDERERIELTVYAGKRCFVPIVVASKFYELSWEFTSAPKDVGFGIAFKSTEEESNENLQTLVPFSRYMSHKSTIHGKMEIDNPGLYYLCFSNAFSRFTSKTVECYISLTKCIITQSE